MKAFFAAWQFLTIIPLPKWRVFSIITQTDPHHLSYQNLALEESAKYFPWVGLILGLIIASLNQLFLTLLPDRAASAITVLVLWGLSGGLHADGLADSADGFFSSRPKEKILEIMRDSRSGPMAIVGLIAVFSLKWSTLMDLSIHYRFKILTLTMLLSRLCILLEMNLIPYARKSGGLASVFLERTSKGALFFSWLITSLGTTYFLGLKWLMVIVGTFAFTVLMAYYCFRRIGGFTGDTLGALCELSEVFVLVSSLMLQRFTL